MKVVDVDSKIVQKLRRSDTSMQMRTLESADWIVIDENYGKNYQVISKIWNKWMVLEFHYKKIE